MGKSKNNQREQFTCHHGKGKVIDLGNKTDCTKRSGKICTGAGSKCKRIGK